ncbi:hypothetical protein BU23DRAFT_470603 [Bimuria novae-zelandiae CBS 107.79]|uniref:Xylanolytic transcriptional activator regulatory domain-containing protein n=1 Tax=Bimuria novae-zelandiae CBS 107.79 TaxID=1447943 RepID=A0A6A5V3L7_9PLEO|nr:hypothetical protein BU23DRAFT_470603 [Bimuria novae-zelandiae CBS 107.79]
MKDGPPCSRCAERNLSCVLNKSLQTLIDERSQWKATVIQDIDRMHGALQQVLGKLSLPMLPPLLTGTQEHEASPHDYVVEKEEAGPSCDNSPRLSPRDDAVPHVPIESLYQITRLRALRADDPEEQKPVSSSNPDSSATDFISRGLVSIGDATRLVDFYFNRIDHYMYTVGRGKYHDFEHLRRGSPLLLACICTVAALHDPMSNHLYGVCKREFQRLMAASMFDRRVDRDHLRAMCIGAYWLHDISWTLSGYAIRRATEANLSSNYHRLLAKGGEDALDSIRIWYVLYICDHHLSILYGRPSIVREDGTISGWEHLLKVPGFTESDKRLVSQMALLSMMSNVRELFGPDTGEPVPQAFAPQLVNYSRQIDQWMGYWTTELLKLHQHLGEFPTKGVILHHHLAKLHLHSHVFRGLKGAPVPSYFQDSAAAAVSAATSTVEMLLSDRDIREGLVGIPHYLHSMIAFACVFLLKITVQHSGQYIDDEVVFDLTNKAVHQFRNTSVGKWHLVHMMAEGLEKLVASRTTNTAPSNGQPAVLATSQAQTSLGFHQSPHMAASLAAPNGFYEGDLLNTGFDDECGLGTSTFLSIQPGELDFDFFGFGL